MSMNYTLMSVPLFVLMAGLLQRAGIADQLFRAVNVWAGGLRGGLAIGTIIANAIKALDLGPWGTVILMNLIWCFLGCFLDWIGILFLTVPIFLPLILEWGFDPVWFGVVYCMNMHLSYLTPPFAPSAFYLKSITPPDVTMTQICKATMPYLWWTVAANIVTVGWPGLSLWLPKLMLRH
jgi:TRAP-type mannitol/chloroaromatic compound transport system permease large subunit